MARSAARRSPTAGNRGNGGKWLHPSTRRRIYARDGWRCVWCQRSVAQLPSGSAAQATIDHVVPRSRGGSNRYGNLITCCAACNAKRGDSSVPAFAQGDAAIVRRVRAARRRKLPPDHAREAERQLAEVRDYIDSHPDPLLLEEVAA